MTTDPLEQWLLKEAVMGRWQDEVDAATEDQRKRAEAKAEAERRVRGG